MAPATTKIRRGGKAMVCTGKAIAGLTVIMIAIVATPAAAQVLDAAYRGTLMCDKLPFTENRMREAINVTISGGAVRYTHVVRLRKEAVEATVEHGNGTLSGRNIKLQGSWNGENRQYKSNYSGTFVRRSARLTGTQTWTGGGGTVTRTCSGAIKRPLRAFLPRNRKPPVNP
jgi:hypothetical protein